MWLKSFLLVIFLCSYIGYGETSLKKCYCGYIEFEISDNDSQSKAKPPVHCTQGIGKYDSEPLNGNCYTTYEHKSCKNPNMNCENGVSSILLVYFNKFDGYDRTLDNTTDKSGSINSYEDGFAITFKCPQKSCAGHVITKESELLLQNSSYQEFTEKILFIKKKLTLIAEETTGKIKEEGKELKESVNVQSIISSYGIAQDLKNFALQPTEKATEHKWHVDVALKAADSSDNECYCGIIVIALKGDNPFTPELDNTIECRRGVDGFDPSLQNGRCYTSFHNVPCKRDYKNCDFDTNIHNYLLVYYNKMDENTDKLTKNQTIRGHLNYDNTDRSFDLTLYCEGDKCAVDLDTPAAKVSMNGGMNIEYSQSIRIIKAVANKLQKKPKALPPTTTTPPPTIKNAEAIWCHCGYLRLECDRKFTNITKRPSKNCTQNTTSEYNPAALNKRCYVTFESERCQVSKDCQPLMDILYNVYFNKFVGYNRSLDSKSDIVGIVNSYKDEYTFSVTLTCGQDFCTPNASYASTQLLESNLGKTAISDLHSKLVALVNIVDSEQKPMAMVKSTTPLYNGYHYLDESVEPTTKSDTGLGKNGRDPECRSHGAECRRPIEC